LKADEPTASRSCNSSVQFKEGKPPVSKKANIERRKETDLLEDGEEVAVLHLALHDGGGLLWRDRPVPEESCPLRRATA
jgi:hypothetical protein